jgi:2-amino-4-hydroxy-6-hydroxymethyldihydropteridine diphosphokinase
MRAAVTAYVGLGANLGDARQAVTAALQQLGQLSGTRVCCHSALYLSRPVNAAGPDFINAVTELSTALPAPELLQALHGIEQRAGRERPYRNAPRTLDLDLLRYGDTIMQSAVLTLPHPRMGERAFVLLPLAEIAPALVTPAQLAQVAAQRIERL